MHEIQVLSGTKFLVIELQHHVYARLVIELIAELIGYKIMGLVHAIERSYLLELSRTTIHSSKFERSFLSYKCI